MAELALKPSEFWDLTPFEFKSILEGYIRRDKSDWMKTAWLAANIMNMWSKRKITVRSLAPWIFRGGDGDANRMTKEELEQISRRNKAKFWTKISDKFRPDKTE